MFAEFGPHWCPGTGAAARFEVIDINAKKKLLFDVFVQTFPSLDAFETAFGNGFVAVLLPVQPGQRVAV